MTCRCRAQLWLVVTQVDQRESESVACMHAAFSPRAARPLWFTAVRAVLCQASSLLATQTLPCTSNRMAFLLN